ncbi:MAG: hypothetical protein RIK87_05140 [Fuerstiella sp.]
MAVLDQPQPDLLATSQPEPDCTRKERRLGLVLSGGAFFAGYVLSAGPAVFMVEKFDLPMIGSIVQVLYAPLVLIVKLKVPVLAPVIQAYVELFR